MCSVSGRKESKQRLRVCVRDEPFFSRNTGAILFTQSRCPATYLDFFSSDLVLNGSVFYYSKFSQEAFVSNTTPKALMSIASGSLSLSARSAHVCPTRSSKRRRKLPGGNNSVVSNLRPRAAVALASGMQRAGFSRGKWKGHGASPGPCTCAYKLLFRETRSFVSDLVLTISLERHG